MALKCRGTNRRGEPCARVPARGEDICKYHAHGEVVQFLDWARKVINGAARMDAALIAQFFIFAAQDDQLGPEFLAELDRFEERMHPGGAVAAATKRDEASGLAPHTETTDAHEEIEQ